MKKKEGKLVILSGPSGCGKTTISEHLTRYPQFVRSVSATTRPPRPDERHGVDYFFISTDEFQKKIEEGEFIEYTAYHDNLYGTPLKPLEDALEKGLFFLLVIEVNGALQIMKKFPDNAISIFILPPDTETLCKRLSDRKTDTTKDVEKRLEIAKKEMEHKSHYDYCIVNEYSEQTADKIRKIVHPGD